MKLEKILQRVKDNKLFNNFKITKRPYYHYDGISNNDYFNSPINKKINEVIAEITKESKKITENEKIPSHSKIFSKAMKVWVGASTVERSVNENNIEILQEIHANIKSAAQFTKENMEENTTKIENVLDKAGEQAKKLKFLEPEKEKELNDFRERIQKERKKANDRTKILLGASFATIIFAYLLKQKAKMPNSEQDIYHPISIEEDGYFARNIKKEREENENQSKNNSL